MYEYYPLPEVPSDTPALSFFERLIDHAQHLNGVFYAQLRDESELDPSLVDFVPSNYPPEAAAYPTLHPKASDVEFDFRLVAEKLVRACKNICECSRVHMDCN